MFGTYLGVWVRVFDGGVFCLVILRYLHLWLASSYRELAGMTHSGMLSVKGSYVMLLRHFVPISVPLWYSVVEASGLDLRVRRNNPYEVAHNFARNRLPIGPIKVR